MFKLLVSIKESKFKQLFIFLCLSFVIFALILDPAKYINVCLNGILVFCKNILPALLPFMFFTKLLTATGYIEHLSKVLNPLTKKLYNCPAISSYIFTMSILSGYPLGAKLTADLFEKGAINREEAHRICSFTSNSGPLFIVGTVGTSMFCCPTAGYIILLSHILAALINGLIYRKYTPKPLKESIELVHTDVNSSTMSNAMESSVISVLLIGGYIAIFFIITEILASFHVFSPIISLFNACGVDSGLTKGVLNGFFEITNGCGVVAKLPISIQIKTVLSSFIISFGGLAVAFQGLTFLNKFKISKKYFFVQKFTHAIIAAGLATIFVLVIPL